MRHRSMSSAVPCLLALVVGAGCSSTPSTRQPQIAPHTAAADPLPPTEYPNIIMLENTHRYLVCGAPRVEPPDGERPLRVTVPFRSLASESISIDYRYRFFDQDGNPMRTGSEWRRMIMTPQVQELFIGAAHGVAATDWQLEVELARFGT